MKTHKYVDGLCYTLKILCPEVKELAERELGKLEGLIEKRMPLEKAHLGLKYLGYDRDYEIEEIIDLVPEIKLVVDRYLPMEIRISGLGGFWNTKEWPSKPIIFLGIEENKGLREMHEELGLNNFSVQVIVRNFFTYPWPKWHQLNRGYHGQKQSLVIATLTPQQSIILDPSEVIRSAWVKQTELIASLHPVRKEMASQLIDYLSSL